MFRIGEITMEELIKKSSLYRRRDDIWEDKETYLPLRLFLMNFKMSELPTWCIWMLVDVHLVVELYLVAFIACSGRT